MNLKYIHEYFYLYRITNIVDGKVYIGQTVNPKTRWKDHKYSKKKNYLYNAIEKHNIQNFVFEIIAQCKNINDNYDNINESEIECIAQYDSCNRNIGYNIDHGGQNSLKTEETKEKMSKSLLGKNLGKIPSEETKKKISKALLGRTLSEEVKNKMSKSKLGRYKGIEHSMYGKMVSEETKSKISKAMLGRAVSEETKEKMSKSSAKLSEENILQIRSIYPNLTMLKIANQFGVSKSAIRNILKGKSYKWVI